MLVGLVRTLSGIVRTLPGNVRTRPGSVRTLMESVRTLLGSVRTLLGIVRTLPGIVRTHLEGFEPIAGSFEPNFESSFLVFRASEPNSVDLKPVIEGFLGSKTAFRPGFGGIEPSHVGYLDSQDWD